jgi:hypothetical protein
VAQTRRPITASIPEWVPALERTDYLQRIIAELAAALARIAGHAAAGQPAAGLEEIRQAYAALGVEPRLVASLEAVSLARLLRLPERVRAVARLLTEEAALHLALGQAPEARRCAQRARALLDTLTPEHEG